MRRKCERGRGNINADGAGAEVFAGDGCSQGASFIPMAAISQRGQGGRIIIIRVRASRCGESALNSPPSQPIPRRRSAPTPSIFSPPSEHFHSPSQRRRTPADLTTHSPPKICSRPRTATRPARALSHSLPAQTHTRRLRDAFLADLTTHSPPKTCTRPSTTTRPPRALSHSLPSPTHARRLRDARPPTPQPIPRRRPSPVPAQRHALPEHFLTPFPLRRTPAGCADARPPTSPPIPHRRPSLAPAAPRCPPPFRSASGTKKRHRTVHVRCRLFRSTVVAVGHLGW